MREVSSSIRVSRDSGTAARSCVTLRQCLAPSAGSLRATRRPACSCQRAASRCSPRLLEVMGEERGVRRGRRIRGSRAALARWRRASRAGDIDWHARTHPDQRLPPPRHGDEKVRHTAERTDRRLVEPQVRLDTIRTGAELITGQAGIELVERCTQLRLVVCEVLVFRVIARKDNGGQIVGTKFVDDVERDLLRRFDAERFLRNHRVVHHEDPQAAQRFQVVCCDVRWNVFHPPCCGRWRVVDVEGSKGDDLLRLAVFEDREVFFSKAFDRLTMLVEDRHVQLDDFYA